MPADYDKIRDDNIREYGQGTRHLSFLGPTLYRPDAFRFRAASKCGGCWRYPHSFQPFR